MKKIGIVAAVICGVLTGCTHKPKGNVGMMPTFAVPKTEAEWIKNGEALAFENEQWYPQDSIDILMDAEVEAVGTYQGTTIFIDKMDVRPYNRLYTKFAKDKFRIYKKKHQYD